MSESQLRRMDEIECYRPMVYNLSRTDRIGLLLTKSLDLQQTVVRDVPSAESLSKEVELLRNERMKAMDRDPNREDVTRAAIYAVIATTCIMIESIIERFEERALQPPDYLSPLGYEGEAFDVADPPESYLMVKDEEVDLIDELPQVANNDPAAPESTDILPMVRMLEPKVAAKRTNNDSTDADEAETSQPVRKRLRSSALQKGEQGDGASNCSATTPTTPTASKAAAAARHFSCDKCGKQCNTEKGLKFHETVHNGVQCGECNQHVKNGENLLKHYAEKHPGKQIVVEKKENWPRKCPVCAIKFQDYSHYKAHILIHTGEKPFTCSTCPAAFRATSMLNKHLREAHGEKPYECTACAVKFGLQTELLQHNKSDEHIRKVN